jgi:hypothetical protein
MRTLDELDKWDYQLIDGCKTLRFTLDDAKKIWGKRNAAEPEFVDVSWLLSRMMDIVLLTNPTEDVFQMVIDAAPENSWKFVVHGKVEEYNYTVAWFRVLSSRSAMTLIKDIPGYTEWIDNKSTKGSIASI